MNSFVNAPIDPQMRTRRSRLFLSLAVFLAGLLVTAIIAHLIQSSVDEADQRDFELQCKVIEDAVLERLRDCEAVLHGAATFINHGAELSTRDEWRHYIADQTQARPLWSGIQGVGFAPAIARADLPRHVAALRADGFPNYQIKPAGDRETYSPIIYIEPFTNRNLRALGYDMLSEPVRREAMERARDQNATALSGAVVLVQETGQDIQSGTLMYVPVYRRNESVRSVGERRAALLGWVYSPYRMDDLMHAIRPRLLRPDGRTMRLEVFDGAVAARTALLHDSAARDPRPKDGGTNRTQKVPMKFAGHLWTLSLTRANPALLEARVWGSLVGGAAMSLLLAGLAASLLSTRFKAEGIAWRLTAELRSSEEKFRAIADYTVDLELWFGRDKKILWVSPSVERMTGYSVASVMGQPDFIGSIATADGANAEALAAFGRGVVLGGSDRAREIQCYHKDRTPFWLSLSWQPIFDGGGRSLGLRVSGRDITLLKEVESRLYRANHVVEQSNASIVITDRNGTIEYVNAEFTRATGYWSSEVLGKNVRILKSGVTRAELYREMWLALKAGEGWHGDFQSRKKNGEIFWETVTISPIREPSGHISHYVAIKQDISERKKLQLELQASEARFIRLAEQTGTFVWRVDAHGLYTHVSPLIERVLGYRPDELVGRMYFYDLHPSGGREEFKASSLAIFGRREPFAERISAAQGKDGRALWLSTTGEAELAADGSLLGYTGSDTDVTARYRQERATNENLNNFRAFFETINDMVFVGSTDGKLIAANRATVEILGYSEAELGAMNLFEVHPADLRPEAEAIWAAVFRGERSRSTLPLLRKDRNAVPVDTRLWFGQWNGRDCLFMVAKSLSAEQEAHQQLERMTAAATEYSDRFNLAARAGGVGIWDYIVGESKLVWDEQMTRLYGLTGEHSSNSTYDRWRHSLHPADRQWVEEELQAALNGKNHFDTEFRIVWPDGSAHAVRALAIVQRDTDGRPLRMLGTNWDITAEKQAASKLRRNESLLQLMFHASPLGFLVVDNRTDAILQFNERFCELWGITHLAAGMRRGELKNNDIIPDCLPMLVDVPAFAASCAPLQDVETRVVVEDKIAFTHERTIRRYTSQIRDEMDEYHGRFYIFEDITARMRLESETAANLEKERQVSAMKTRFISVASHEFRAPMAAAMLSADTLNNHLEQLSPTKRTELFARINTSMRRMTNMLDEVLVLSRMDAGGLKLNFESIDLMAFTKAAMIEVQAGDHAAHRFEFHAEGSFGPFVTEPALLGQILSNLLSNAARYSPAGTTIATSLEADHGRVRLTVEDRGIGIPEADRARIFEPFERGSNVGSINGTGLGLNIVQRMTEILRGTIAYEPVPAGGSRFILILPSYTPSPS